MPAVRRRAVLQRVEEEAEAGLRLLVGDLQQPEDAGLHLGLVDSDASAADLVAVQHEVIGARADRGRVPPPGDRDPRGGAT